MGIEKIRYDNCIQKYTDFWNARRAFRSEAVEFIELKLRKNETDSLDMNLTIEVEDACGLSTLEMPTLDTISFDKDGNLVFIIEGSKFDQHQLTEYELLQIVQDLENR